MTELRPITLDEVVKGILDNNRRDFSNTRLGNGDLSGHERYTDLQKYLNGLSHDNLQRNPLIIDGSVWQYLIAKGLYLPFLRAQKANLINANLSNADLSGADLRDAKLYMSILNGTDLNGADMSDARLYGANLSRADLSRALFLENAIFLENAEYDGTIVSPEQKIILTAAFEKAGKKVEPHYFVVK